MAKANSRVKKWELLGRKELFSAPPWIKLFADTVRVPGGRVIDDFYRVELPDYVMICPRDKKGRLLFVRQYKHALGNVTLLFPTGFVERGESPAKAAKRELLEETGYKAKTWKHVGSFMIDGTRGCGKAHFYFAENLKKATEPLVDDMEISESVFLTVSEIMKAIEAKEISLFSAVSLFGLATNPLIGKIIKANGKK